MWLNTLELENFKSFKHLHYPLTRFNILIGPNSTGKSSILQSLLILKNTMKKKPYSGIVLRTEAYDYGNYEDIVTGKNQTQEVTIRINGAKFIPNSLYDDEARSEFWYNLSFTNDGPTGIRFGVTLEYAKITFDWRVNKDIKSNFRDADGNPRAITHSLEGIHPRLQMSENDNLAKNFNRVFGNSNYTYELLKDLYHIPFNRTMTKYAARLTQLRDDVLESKPEDLAASNLSNLSKNTTLMDKVSQFMNDLIGKTIRHRNLDMPTSSGDQGVTFDFIKNGFSNAIANEGTGPNQVILLLSIILGTPKNSIIMIDEPEIHLHPKAQSKLAKIIMQISREDHKQIIFATHSEHMLYPFLAAVANKKIHPDELSVCYLDQTTDSSPKIEKLQVNDHGQLKGGLRGFWDADLEMLKEFSSKND